MSLTYRLHRYDALGSTNDEAKRLAELGAPEGTAVLAETQTAGRGRAGRTWITPRGAAIALSIILRPQKAPDPQRLPAQVTHIALLGGLAVLEGIRRTTALDPRLKWPNDVLVRGKKVAGVLAEAGFSGEALEYAVLGMGVNVNAGPPPELRLEYEATSLAAEHGSLLDREVLTQAILSTLDQRYPQIGTPDLAAAWSQNLAMRGEQVQVTGGAETLAGVLESVRDDGALVLRLADGTARTIVSGDVRLRAASP